MELNANSPTGPIEIAWERHRFSMKLVSPANRRKHTVIVKPAERLSVAVTADAPGRWAFHCHLLLHMDAGMFRVVEVADNEQGGHS